MQNTVTDVEIRGQRLLQSLHMYAYMQCSYYNTLYCMLIEHTILLCHLKALSDTKCIVFGIQTRPIMIVTDIYFERITLL